MPVELRAEARDDLIAGAVVAILDCRRDPRLIEECLRERRRP